MHFLIVLLAIIILESSGQLAFIQRDTWVQLWHNKLSELAALRQSALFKLVAFVLLPVVALILVIMLLESTGNGLLLFLLELAVLLYSFGRGDISQQIQLLKSDLERNDLQAAYHDAAVFNIAHRSSSAESASDLYRELISALPYRMFERRFAAVFWFFLLGAPAALAYRLFALHGDMELDKPEVAEDHPQLDETEVAQTDADSDTIAPCRANTALWLMEWIPVRLLALTLGLVGSFSHALEPLQELAFCPRTSTADVLRRCVNGALGDISQPFVENSDQAEENAEVDPVNSVQESDSGLALIGEMVALFTRAMMGWLVVIALLVMLS